MEELEPYIVLDLCHLKCYYTLIENTERQNIKIYLNIMKSSYGKKQQL